MTDYSKKIDELFERVRFHVSSDISPDEVKSQVIALLQDAQDEIEKAYGGCRKCYGKGYATTIEGTRTIRGNNNDWRTHIKFCSCERGKQLESLQTPKDTKQDRGIDMNPHKHIIQTGQYWHCAVCGAK